MMSPVTTAIAKELMPVRRVAVRRFLDCGDVDS